MPTREHFDLIVIGSGAGGGTLTWSLASTGKRILLLERGDYVPREIENWSTEAVVEHGRYHNAEIWLDRHGVEFQPGTHYFVGGNTKFFGAALLRMREADFGEVRHFGGLSPAWPITYADLEPYYTRAEQLFEVHGRRGEDPTEPSASAPYPFPPVSHEPRIQRLSDGLEALGHHPFHVPLGIMLDESDRHRSACIRCATCDGHPCLVNAKADAQVCCVDPALQHPNVTLLTGARADRIVTNASGTAVDHVDVTRGGVTESYSADVVVVSCGAINSAALLLRSASDLHPDGLANGSGCVGRYYMCHINSVLLAVSRCANPTIFQKTLGLNDFYFGAPDWDFPLGHVSFVGKTDRHVLAAGAPRFVPGWTLDQMARHSLDFWLTSEDLPDPDNRVTLSSDGCVKLSYVPNNTEGHRRLTAKVKDLVRRVPCAEHGDGCIEDLINMNAYVGKRIPLAGVAHQNGTLRFGRSPADSVLDENCRAHELDNLYVVDSSFFPSSSAVNPALTVIANALRVAEHLKHRLGAGREATLA